MADPNNYSTINPAKLHEELVSAGIPVNGVGANGNALRIDFDPAATAQQIQAAQTVVGNHDKAQTQGQQASGRLLPPLVLAALTIRASASFAGLTATQKAKVQAVIDNAAANLLDLLT